MKAQATFLIFALVALVPCIGCNSAPGRPGPDSEVIPPDQIMEFNVLFASNCSGCHGANGNGGAAVSLSDPVFLAIADDTVIRRVATNGVPGTSDAGLRAERRWHAYRQANRRHRQRNPLLGEAGCVERR